MKNKEFSNWVINERNYDIIKTSPRTQRFVALQANQGVSTGNKRTETVHFSQKMGTAEVEVLRNRRPKNAKKDFQSFINVD